MPGTTTIGLSPIAWRTSVTSAPETTTPAAPASTASNAREAGDARPSPARLESTVTATTRGPSRPASAAPFAAPSTAARTMSGPPSACTVSRPTPNRPASRAAAPTELGMSWSFKSRKTGMRSRTRSTAAGPAATKSSSPTLRKAIIPASRSASAAAAAGSATSAATISGFRDTLGTLHLSRQVGRRRQPARGQELTDAVRDLDRGVRVREVGGSHLHRPGAREEELDRVARRRDATHPDDRDARQRLRDLVDAADGDGTDGGPREPAGHRGEARAERLHVDRHPKESVDERDPMRAGVH